MSEAPAVLVQLGWRAGWWACRSLRAAGFRVIGGQDEAAIAIRSRACSRLVRYPLPRSRPEEFVGALEQICAENEVAAVLPTDDEVVRLLAAHLPRPGGAVVVGPTLEQFTRLADKSALAVLAGEAGFASPRGVVVGPEGARGEWPALPSMVKPCVTGADSEQGLVSRKPVLVRSEQERAAAVRELVDLVGEALVEEQVRGAAWRVHFVRDPSRTLTLALRALRSYPLYTGQGSVLQVAPAPGGLVAAAERLLSLVDYRGPGSIQLIERDGRFYVHDVNLRLPLTVGGTIRAGFDMPRLAVESALGRPLAPAPAGARPVTYVSLDGELRRLRDGLRGRETGASVPRIAADLVLAALGHHRVLDPFHLRDPLPMVAAPAEAVRRARRLRRKEGTPEPTPGASLDHRSVDARC